MRMRTKIFEKRKELIEGLNAYISPIDPSWRDRLIPPEPEELGELQKFIEIQKGNMGIPESYLKFACYAAEGDGGLLSDVLKGEFYTIKLPENTHNLQNGELLDKKLFDIEFLWDEMGVEYIIDVKNGGKISYGRSYYISSSFEKLLFQCAVLKFEDSYYSNYLSIGYNRYFTYEQKKSLDKVLKEFIWKNQMQMVWFNDEYFFFAYNQECSILLEQYELMKGRIGVGGRFFGNDSDKMQKELLPQIGARVHGMIRASKGISLSIA